MPQTTNSPYIGERTTCRRFQEIKQECDTSVNREMQLSMVKEDTVRAPDVFRRELNSLVVSPEFIHFQVD